MTNQSTALQKADVKNVQSMMKTFEKQIALALPKHMTSERMARIALTELLRTPKLQQSCLKSFLGGIIQCAQLGLEPGNTLGHAYLLPFWNSKRRISEVVVITGYRGMIELARRSGNVASITARVVKANDEFDVEYGTADKLIHKPAKGDRGEVVGSYAVAHFKGGGHPLFENLSLEDIHSARARSKTGDSSSSPWATDFEAMARKTAVRRIFKFLPVSVELTQAMTMDDLAERGDRSQNNQSYVDVDFAEDWGPTHDRDSMAEDGKVAADEQSRQKLIGDVLQAIDVNAKRLDISEAEVFKRLGVESLADIKSWTLAQLDAAIDAVKDWQ